MSFEFGDLVLKIQPMLRAQRAILVRMAEELVVLASKGLGLLLEALVFSCQIVVGHLARL